MPSEFWCLLNDQPLPDDANPFVALGFDRRAAGVLWRAHREEILAGWIKRRRGTRPSCWWRFDAPQEPRLQVGGKGEPWPQSEFDERRFPMGWLAVDAADPPLLESDAAFLKRLGLLLPGEAQRLRAADYEPVALPAAYRVPINLEDFS